jgi:hypothetical protein
MMRRGLLLFGILASCLFASVAYRYLHEQWIVDDCLSGRHGSFDYSTMSCDLKTNHAYIAYHVRHTHDEAMGLAAVVAFTVSVSAYGYLKLWNRRDNRAGARRIS